MSLPDERLLQNLRAQLIIFGHKNVQRGCGRDPRGGLLSRRGLRQGRGAALKPTHYSINRFKQLVLLSWLEQLSVDPKFASSSRVAWPFPGGQQDNACGREFGSFSDHGGYRQTI